MVESYISLISGGEGEIVEKKSKFIGQIKPVVSEEEAYAFIEKIKKKHYDARHNCFAFSIGVEQPLLRFSDDGEPQGTAGKPILEVITSSKIHNICIVVTRYFGGTLLGTGGLVRAYTDASKAALANCETRLMELLIPTEIKTNYTDMGKIQYILGNHDIKIIDTIYADDVVLKVNILKSKLGGIIKEITDATSARAGIETFDEIYG
ncbi:MAG: YigZ family protein [Lachnospiraceae bacterium]|nr:YigZ family protein [Lachnospiraceae bacterium]